MTSYTDQTVFDTVAKHLLRQRDRSMCSVGSLLSCAYRGTEGRSCAIGCLIPDDLYSPKMEGHGADRLRRHFPAMGMLLHDVSADLLTTLQDLHDLEDPEMWEDELREVARSFNLGEVVA